MGSLPFGQPRGWHWILYKSEEVMSSTTAKRAATFHYKELSLVKCEQHPSPAVDPGLQRMFHCNCNCILKISRALLLILILNIKILMI